MPQEAGYRKRIGIFTTVYMAAAVIALVLLALTVVLLLVIHHLYQPQFTNYGNDAVSGWATIFSGLGYLGGMLGKALLLVLAAVCVIAAVYWIVGLILDILLKKNALAGSPSAKGLGTALGIWTILPGAGSLVSLFTSLAGDGPRPGGILPPVISAAVFLGAGAFLLVTVWQNRTA